MADLSNLSDDELLALQAKSQPPKESTPGAADLSSLSDDDLLAMHDKAAAQAAPKPAAPSMGSSALRGAAQGASLGFADELYGVLGGAVNSVKDGKPFPDAYREARDYARRKDAEAQAANPKTFTAGAIGGGVLSSLAGGGLLSAGKGATVGAAAAKGAATGAATGLGMSDADVTKGEVPRALADSAKGAIVGGLLGGSIQSASQAFNPAVMQHLAETKAFKAATGNNARAWDEATRAGVVNSDGRTLLDSGVVTFGAKPADIAARAAAGKNVAGTGIGDTLGEVDRDVAGNLASGGTGMGPFSPKDAPAAAAGMVDGKAVAQAIREKASGIQGKGNEALIGRLKDAADYYEGKGLFPLAEAQTEKNSWIYRSGDALSESQKARNLVKGSIGDEMENAVGRLDKADAARQAAKAAAPAVAEPAVALKTGTGPTVAAPAPGDAVAQAVDQAGADLNPQERAALADSMRSELGDAAGTAPAGPPQTTRDLLNRYQQLKANYGTMTRTAKNATTLANRMDKNQSIGLKDAVVAAATPTGIPGKIAAAVGSKVLRERGNSMAAVSADAVAKILQQTPEAFGQYSPILLRAAQAGSLPLTHYLLMKKPDYAQMAASAAGAQP